MERRKNATDMTVREGNLQAPTRHPLDWRNAEFYDEAALEREMERIFDICHGCRRCVSLCQSFPTLFDLVDNSKTMEVDGVAKSDYGKVVDQCYLCDLCYMTKCPYVPPHPWNVDFPHLMLRAKAVGFRQGKSRWRDRLLTSTDRVGRLATIPVVVRMVNKVNTMPSARKVMDKALGVAEGAALPPYNAARFRETAQTSVAWPVRAGARMPGKVAVFATCYVNYNEPGIGHDLVRVLEHNEIPYRLVEKEACCGMPKLELGDLESVEAFKDINIGPLAALARAGYAILTAVPSCTLMWKHELPLIFPDDPDVQAVADAMFDPFEYLVLRDKDGLLRRGFHDPARQGELPHSVSFPRAECRAEDARGPRMDSRHRRQHGGALRRTRWHVRREARVLREFHEDRAARLPTNGGDRTRFRLFRLSDRGAPHRAGNGRGGKRARRAEGTSVDAAANGVRPVGRAAGAPSKPPRTRLQWRMKAITNPSTSSLPRRWISTAPSCR